jgi:hypothetical protein
MIPISNFTIFNEVIKSIDKLNKIQILQKEILADNELSVLQKPMLLQTSNKGKDLTAKALVHHLEVDQDFQNCLVSFYDQDVKIHGFFRSPSFFEAKEGLEVSRRSWLFVPHGISVKSVCKAIFPDTQLINAAEIKNLRQFTSEFSGISSLFVYNFQSLHCSYQRILLDLFSPIIAISDYQCSNEDNRVFGFPFSWNNWRYSEPGVIDRIGSVVKILDTPYSRESILSFAFEPNNWKEARIPLDALLAYFMKLINVEYT